MPKALTRRQMAERILFVGTLRRNPLTGRFYPPHDGATKQCECGVLVPADRERCHFCERTERLRRE